MNSKGALYYNKNIYFMKCDAVINHNHLVVASWITYAFLRIKTCPTVPKWHEPEYDFVDLVEYVYEKKLSAYHISR